MNVAEETEYKKIEALGAEATKLFGEVVSQLTAGVMSAISAEAHLDVSE